MSKQRWYVEGANWTFSDEFDSELGSVEVATQVIERIHKDEDEAKVFTEFRENETCTPGVYGFGVLLLVYPEEHKNRPDNHWCISSEVVFANAGLYEQAEAIKNSH